MPQPSQSRPVFGHNLLLIIDNNVLLFLSLFQRFHQILQLVFHTGDCKHVQVIGHSTVVIGIQLHQKASGVKHKRLTDSPNIINTYLEINNNYTYVYVYVIKNTNFLFKN